MPAVEIDSVTLQALEFAARIAGTTPGQVIARLVREASAPLPQDPGTRDPRVPIYSDYEGTRTAGFYDPVTCRIDISTGALAGTSYKSPTGAARAVVSHLKPTVSPHRNGWDFWVLDDGSGKDLQSIR